MRPSWGADGTLVYAGPSNPRSFGRSSRGVRERDGLLSIQKGSIVSAKRDVRFAKFSNEAAAKSLKQHMDLVTIEPSDNPCAILPLTFKFSDLIIDTPFQGNATHHENNVWKLASILWDAINVPEELEGVPQIEQRLRKDNLSAFWAKLVAPASNQQVSMARTKEEKAVAALSGHNVEEACKHLLDGKDFHLATLVSLIGNKDSTRKEIREQLNGWKKTDVLSEFSSPLRTIYELLAGNVCVCDGVKGSPENRIESFTISKRFGLDWRQAFGLRLWYGTLAKEGIEAAVSNYAEDLAQELELAWPSPWYMEQKIQPLWDDQQIDDREDLLYGLLKIFAFDTVDDESVIRPENSQLSPLNYRLSWQLGRALSRAEVTRNPLSEEAEDKMTLSFAAQLTNEGSWIEAVWVLLHLFHDEARAMAIQNHLAHHASLIGADDSENFAKLTQTFKIPASWIWEAKALYMRSVKNDPRAEVDCLIKAGSFEEAHRTFTKDVAPKTIVERDYETLKTLLAGFRGMEISIPEWHLGGEIYCDFLELLESQSKGKEPDYSLLQRLLAGLPAVVQGSRHPVFMETVAMECISGIVAKVVAATGVKGEVSLYHLSHVKRHANTDQKAKILTLPLTEDNYLKHTIELSLGYYKRVMAGGK